MDREEQTFNRQLNVLCDRAKKNKNVLELREIKEGFRDIPLAPSRLEQIILLLEKQGIDVLTMSEEAEEEMEEELLSPQEEVESALHLMDSEKVSCADVPEGDWQNSPA